MPAARRASAGVAAQGRADDERAGSASSVFCARRCLPRCAPFGRRLAGTVFDQRRRGIGVDAAAPPPAGSAAGFPDDLPIIGGNIVSICNVLPDMRQNDACRARSSAGREKYGAVATAARWALARRMLGACQTEVNPLIHETGAHGGHCNMRNSYGYGSYRYTRNGRGVRR